MKGSTALASPLYTEQGVLTLLSRSWNLLKLNLKPTLLVMLLPTLLSTAFHILASLLAEPGTLTSTSAIGLHLGLLLGAFILFFPYIFAILISFCVLSRFYYRAILSSESPDLKECLRHLGKTGPSLLGIMLLQGVILFALTAVEIGVFFVGTLLVGMMTTALAASGTALTGAGKPLVPIMMVSFALVAGFVAMFLLITLISLQSALSAFPLLSLLTTSNLKESIWDHIKSGYKMVFTNISRVVWFTLALVIFQWVLAGVMLLPAWIWVGIEMTRTGLGAHHGLPLHIQTIFNIWGSLCGMLTMPFYISAMSLFWYDCQVRNQGLDLTLWLERLSAGNNKRGLPLSTNPATQP